ncbi:hypothetical protein JEP54_11885 [Proteus mirabilis]|nr:hypothetical protein [Proteus mirabilis]
MNIMTKLGAAVLLTSLSTIAISADIKLTYGINLINFNGDGVKDIVVKSKRILNDASSINMVTVYIKDADEQVYIVPSIYDNALSLFDNKAENSDIKISNFKFIEKKNQVILVSGEKIGNDMLQSTPIRFSSYTITKQDKQYKWAFSAYCVTNSTYLNVDDAFVDPCINKLIRD